MNMNTKQKLDANIFLHLHGVLMYSWAIFEESILD